MRTEGSRKKKRKTSGGGGGGGGVDLFGVLLDELLNHVLSFLPSREAVQASLLSRRWRHLWRSTPASNLLLRRHAAALSPPLRSFEIDANDLLTPPFDESRDDYFEYDDEDKPKVDGHVDLWIDHALSACRARSLTVRTENRCKWWLPRCPRVFSSPHLTTLHLEHVQLLDDLLDFSCCPALLLLTLVDSHLEGETLVSPSLERISAVDCDIEMYTNKLSTPNLRCLELSDLYGLDHWSMPWLTETNIQRTGKTTIFYRKQ